MNVRERLRHWGFSGCAAVALFLATGAAAVAQVAESVQSIAAPAVNTQNTLTIPAVTGQFARVDQIVVKICQDATGNAVSNANFTTTNLQSLGWQVGAAAAPSSCTAPDVLSFPQGGLKAGTAGTAVTIVSPAASTHASFPMAATYHYSSQ